MTKKYSELRAQMSDEAQSRARAKAEKMMEEMPLQELRRAKALSQKTIADVLHVSQARVSKMEKRTDMYLSTLRSHVEAMGGSLDLVANFPEGQVKISNLGEAPQPA